MTRVTELTGENPQFDRIKSLEAEHEQVKVTITLSPRTQFIIERGIQAKLSVSRSSAVRELLEAAALDWAEAKGYDLDSEEFTSKYLSFLSPDKISIEDALQDGILSVPEYERFQASGEKYLTVHSSKSHL